MKSTALQSPSLAQHFDAPAGFTAMFGWACGYSADAAFMDMALERYTRQTRAQRAWDGRAWLGLMLDPGNPMVSIVDAPGLVHCRIEEGVRRPFNLLHAKVALLGFVHESDPGRWLLRLLVSTGNWTRQTMEESLDLAWRLDLGSEALDSGLAEDRLAVADVAAAWRMMEWLRPLFDCRLLERGGGGRLGVAAKARSTFEGWLKDCVDKAPDVRPRFFDNRQESLLSQLPGQITAHARAVRRNYLAMGAGFFESTSEPQGAFPAVPLAIRTALRNKELLTQNAEVDIYVNAANCQAMATISEAHRKSETITIRPAHIPEAVYGANAVRSLHAKFLFGANYREGNPLCRSPWVYLGSGNLTAQGFTLAAAPGVGNLEAGVVFAPPDLPWHAADAAKQGLPAIGYLLPIGWDREIESSGELRPGEGFPDRPDASVACPVPWLEWQPGADGGLLVEAAGSVPAPTRYEVIDPFGEACPRRGAGFLWPGDRPREVTIRWEVGDGSERQGLVPVVDELGRVAGTPLPELSLEAARWQLAEFPSPPVSEDEPSSDPPSAVDEGGAPGPGSGSGATGGYAIRDMMGLVESLAERQVQVAASDWPAWCARVEQTLYQAGKDPAVEAFVRMGINPLQPLHAPPFRPDYAESADSPEGRDYEAMLGRVEQAWGVVGLEPFGSTR